MDPGEFDEGISAIAGKLSHGDAFLCEELISEMQLTVLEMKEGRDHGYYYRAAKNAAIDYLKSKRHNYTYDNKMPHISLDALLDAGFQIDTQGNIYLPALGNKPPDKVWVTIWNLYNPDEDEKK